MIGMHVAQRAQDRNARVIVTRLQLSQRNYLKSRRYFEKIRCDLYWNGQLVWTPALGLYL